MSDAKTAAQKRFEDRVKAASVGRAGTPPTAADCEERSTTQASGSAGTSGNEHPAKHQVDLTRMGGDDHKEAQEGTEERRTRSVVPAAGRGKSRRGEEAEAPAVPHGELWQKLQNRIESAIASTSPPKSHTDAEEIAPVDVETPAPAAAASFGDAAMRFTPHFSSRLARHRESHGPAATVAAVATEAPPFSSPTASAKNAASEYAARVLELQRECTAAKAHARRMAAVAQEAAAENAAAIRDAAGKARAAAEREAKAKLAESARSARLCFKVLVLSTWRALRLVSPKHITVIGSIARGARRLHRSRNPEAHAHANHAMCRAWW